MKNSFVLFVSCWLMSFLTATVIDHERVTPSKITQYGNQITVKNESGMTKIVAVVNDLDQIVAKVKVRPYASVRIDVQGIYSYSVYYKDTYDIEYEYRAGKDPYSDTYVIPSDY